MFLGMVADETIRIDMRGSQVEVLSDAVLVIHGIYECLKKKDETLAQAYKAMVTDNVESIMEKGEVEISEEDKKELVNEFDEIVNNLNKFMDILKDFKNDRGEK